MKRLILAVLLTLCLAAPAWGGFEEGLEAYKRTDYDTALKEFLPLAEQGDADAQFYLGVMYHFGYGVTQDYAEAMKWYRQADEKGYTEAQFQFGVMYYKGQGVPQDYVEAEKWWLKAAEKGFANAQAMLSLMYAKGEGVPQDYVQAHMWSTLAAAQGSRGAAKIRDKTAERMTEEEVAEAQRLAKEWKPKR